MKHQRSQHEDVAQALDHAQLALAGNLLGVTTLVNLVLTSSAGKYFKDYGNAGSDGMESRWTQCVANAIGARIIASRHGRVDPERADAFEPRTSIEQVTHGGSMFCCRGMCTGPFRITASRDPPRDIVKVLGSKGQTRQRTLSGTFQRECLDKGVGRIFHCGPHAQCSSGSGCVKTGRPPLKPYMGCASSGWLKPKSTRT